MSSRRQKLWRSEEARRLDKDDAVWMSPPEDFGCCKRTAEHLQEEKHQGTKFVTPKED